MKRCEQGRAAGGQGGRRAAVVPQPQLGWGWGWSRSHNWAGDGGRGLSRGVTRRGPHSRSSPVGEKP
eukprot:scaffold1017_cov67-Isochrysis_galbana.AAC.1